MSIQIRAIFFCLSLIILILIISAPAANSIPEKSLHPMSVGISLESAKMLPWKVSNRPGYGGTFQFQFDFNRYNSLISYIGFVFVGEDRFMPALPEMGHAKMRLFDIPFQIGLKRYFRENDYRPFGTLTYGSHNMRKKYNYSEGTDPDFEHGLSSSVGIEKQIGSCWFLNSDLCLQAFPNHSYISFRIGLRYNVHMR